MNMPGKGKEAGRFLSLYASGPRYYRKNSQRQSPPTSGLKVLLPEKQVIASFFRMR